MFFVVVDFLQTRNENKSTWGIIVVKLNLFVRFLEEIDDPKNHFENNWPLFIEKKTYLGKQWRQPFNGFVCQYPLNNYPEGDINILDHQRCLQSHNQRLLYHLLFLHPSLHLQSLRHLHNFRHFHDLRCLHYSNLRTSHLKWYAK